MLIPRAGDIASSVVRATKTQSRPTPRLPIISGVCLLFVLCVAGQVPGLNRWAASAASGRIGLKEQRAYAERLGLRPMERLPWHDEQGRDVYLRRQVEYAADPEGYVARAIAADELARAGGGAEQGMLRGREGIPGGAAR
ncbi:MAG: hypothetical protein AAFU70_01555 [Planctomycetota bacterium]